MAKDWLTELGRPLDDPLGVTQSLQDNDDWEWVAQYLLDLADGKEPARPRFLIALADMFHPRGSSIKQLVGVRRKGRPRKRRTPMGFIGEWTKLAVVTLETREGRHLDDALASVGLGRTAYFDLLKKHAPHGVFDPHVVLEFKEMVDGLAVSAKPPPI